MHDTPTPPQQHFEYVAKKPSSRLGSIIKFPPPKTENETYKDLACTEQDRANITELIFTLAENGQLALLFKQSYVKNLGAQINHVHPLKFLAAIFTNPQLKESMEPIFEDYFKRNGFMEGLGGSLTREADQGRLERYLNDFAKEVNVPASALRTFFQNRDWENLVRYLMQS